MITFNAGVQCQNSDKGSKYSDTESNRGTLGGHDFIPKESKQDHGNEEVQKEEVSLMQKYFNQNYPKVTNFQLRKFNSEKFDPNQI